ncbi:unnamed protein product [Prunus armeniaca]
MEENIHVQREFRRKLHWVANRVVEFPYFGLFVAQVINMTLEGCVENITMVMCIAWGAESDNKLYESLNLGRFSLILSILLFTCLERTYQGVNLWRLSLWLLFAAQGVLTKVAALATEQFSLAWGFKGELAKLRDSLSLMQNILRDAAEQPTDRGHTVKAWVKKLKDIVQDADEVLDEFQYEVLRSKLELSSFHRLV